MKFEDKVLFGILMVFGSLAILFGIVALYDPIYIITSLLFLGGMLSFVWAIEK